MRSTRKRLGTDFDMKFSWASGVSDSFEEAGRTRDVFRGKIIASVRSAEQRGIGRRGFE